MMMKNAGHVAVPVCATAYRKSGPASCTNRADKTLQCRSARHTDDVDDMMQTDDGSSFGRHGVIPLLSELIEVQVRPPPPPRLILYLEHFLQVCPLHVVVV